MNLGILCFCFVVHARIRYTSVCVIKEHLNYFLTIFQTWRCINVEIRYCFNVETRRCFNIEIWRQFNYKIKHLNFSKSFQHWNNVDVPAWYVRSLQKHRVYVKGHQNNPQTTWILLCRDCAPRFEIPASSPGAVKQLRNLWTLTFLYVEMFTRTFISNIDQLWKTCNTIQYGVWRFMARNS